MNRDEAKNLFWRRKGTFEIGLDRQYEKVISSYYIGSEFDKFIDKIYDDFESRTCENCYWYSSEVCTNDESPLCADFVSEDYGCILFERKEDETI